MEFLKFLQNTINCKKNAPRNAGHKVAFDAYTYFIFSTFAFTSSKEPSKT
jgi:hypothetical protein